MFICGTVGPRNPYCLQMATFCVTLRGAGGGDERTILSSRAHGAKGNIRAISSVFGSTAALPSQTGLFMTMCPERKRERELEDITLICAHLVHGSSHDFSTPPTTPLLYMLTWRLDLIEKSWEILVRVSRFVKA